MKILAVDDDLLILDLLEASLEVSEYTNLIKAESAEDALDLIEALDGPHCQEGEGAFDVFLLDIQMPGMNGIELCKRIRAFSAYKNTPIIMISSLSDRKHINDAFSAGATDYIMKPFDDLEVTSRIRLANMIVDDRKKVLESYFNGLVGESARNSMFDAYFRQPMVFEDLPDLVDYRVLENYLVKISRKDLYRTAAIGFRLAKADEIFTSIGPEKFSHVLKLITGSINKFFADADSLLSYLGSGYFIMLSKRSTLSAANNLSAAINQEVVSESSKYSDTKLDVVVGEPVDCYLASKEGVQMLISKTIGAIPNEGEVHQSKTLSSVSRMRQRAKKYNVWPGDK